MRKIFTIIATMLLWTVSMFAQAPQKMAYQAVVRDADGKVITDQELGVQVSILQGSVDGASVYSESHTTTTTTNGAINIEIGGGKSSDDFSAIDWSKGPFFVQSTTEVNGKSVTVTSQLLSVPYAQYAETVSKSYIQSLVSEMMEGSGVQPSTPVEVNKENGVLPGKFSVSPTKKVQFAMGNLQYQASTKKWRFAENQYDVIGYDNENISATYSGWIDLFGYGTSGSNTQPYETSNHYSDYPKADIVGTNNDWGKYNAISNGGNKAGLWGTLTKDEMEYLLEGRPNAKKLNTSAVVCNMPGYIILPDDWKAPAGITMIVGVAGFYGNVYNPYQWSVLEQNGALFLPCAGYRLGGEVESIGFRGHYWSGSLSAANTDDAFELLFLDEEVLVYGNYRYDGYSVRLAREITE